MSIRCFVDFVIVEEIQADIQIACAALGVAAKDVFSKSRDQPFIFYRHHIRRCLCEKYLHIYSLKMIAHNTDKCDHSTMIHSRQTSHNLSDTNELHENIVATIKLAIKSERPHITECDFEAVVQYARLNPETEICELYHNFYTKKQPCL
jgi:hypothetical protein